MSMPWIIWRCVFRDVLIHALLALAAISLLIAVGNVLRFLEDLAGTGVAVSALGRLVLAILPTFLCYAIPTALVFGVLITYGRMSADGELIALGSSGFSVVQMFPPVLALSAAAALATAWLMAEVGPRSYVRLKQLARDVGKHAVLLDPGEFKGIGDRVLFFRSRGGEDCPMRGVVIADLSAGDDFFVMGACGYMHSGAARDQLVFHLASGAIQFAERGDKRFRMLYFDELELPLDLAGSIARRRWPREFTTPELLALQARAGADPEWSRLLWVQVHRRVAFPLASVVLAILAVPLGIRPLRTGRSSGALMAVAVMGGYWVIASAGENAAEVGVLPALVGVWFADVLFLALGIALARRSSVVDA